MEGQTADSMAATMHSQIRDDQCCCSCGGSSQSHRRQHWQRQRKQMPQRYRTPLVILALLVLGGCCPFAVVNAQVPTAMSAAAGSSIRSLAFTASLYNATVAECAGWNQCGRRTYVTSPVRMGIPLEAAAGDPGRSVTCSYRITNGLDRTFRVEARIVGGFCFLFMKIRTEGAAGGGGSSLAASSSSSDLVNRERLAEYEVHIRAEVVDASGVRHSPATVLRVTISDVNDAAPLFERSEYVAEVSDGLAPFAEVARVRAVDSDIGANADVFYWLASHADKLYIHPTSGAVHLAVPLDAAAASPELLVRVVAQNSNSTTPRGSSPQRGQTLLKLRVRPANDWPPEIEIVRPLLRLATTTPTNSTAALIVLRDRDRGTSGEIDRASVRISRIDAVDGMPDSASALQPGSGMGSLFALYPLPGEPLTYSLVTVRPLRELAGHVNVTVQAADRGSPSRTGSVVVPLFVSAVIQMPSPAGESATKSIRIDVNETTPVGTALLYVRGGDRSGSNSASRSASSSSGAIFASCSHSIVSGNEGGWFTVHNISGVLLLTKELDADRKDVAAGSDRGNGRTLSIRVQAICRGTSAAATGSSSRGQVWQMETYNIAVTVLDCNDNAPEFPISVDAREASVREDAPPGTVVLTVSAVDADSGENGALTYALVDPPPGFPFRLNATTGVVTVGTESLDYDRGRRRHWLRVRASDRGQPYRRESEASYAITVLNANDNLPLFEKASCAVALSAAAPADTVLLTASALDLDEHAAIEYQLSSGSSGSGSSNNGGSSGSDCFAVDRLSGVLRVTCSHALGSGSSSVSYNLELIATDGKFYSSPLPVTISVLEARLMNGRDVSVDCRDGSAKRQLDLALREAEQNNPPANLQPPRLASVPINREAPRLLGTASRGSVQLTVREDQPLGTIVTTFTATDADAGYAGLVRYALAATGNEEGCFRVDAETGRLVVVAPLDRESVSVYRLTLIAADDGQPVRSVTAAVVVQVLDANDNAPRFAESAYAVTVSEAAEPGTVVLRVIADDPDEGGGGRVAYELGSGNVGGAFAVDRATGWLSVRMPLDRESRAAYALEMVARDGGSPPLSATVVVSVTIGDVNDNAPTFRQPVYKIKVREDLPVGTVVGRLVATDPDLGEGGAVTYKFHGSGAFGKFTVDRQTGIVRIADELDYEQKSTYLLAVRARDGGSERRESSCQLEVHVIDVNENLYAPQFEELVYEGSVKENAPIDTVVLRVTASDDDRSAGDRTVYYSIRDGSGLGRFTIDAAGNIRTSVSLDRESQSSYWLVVYAQDGGTVPLASSVEVFITVLDENDNAPRPDRIMYYASVPENHPGGFELVTIRAHDDDESSKTSLSYSITGRNAKALFTVDGDTGTVRTTRRRLDRESTPEHLLEVTINDNGTPPLTTTVFVVIRIEDENDEAPVFHDRLSSVNVPLSHDFTMPIYHVSAQDRDAGANGTVTYRLEANAPAWLRIDSRTGEIYAAEPQPPAAIEASFTVVATDGGPIPRSASKVLKVALGGASRASAAAASIAEQPLLRADASDAVVNEKEPVGTFVETVRYRDLGDGRPGVFYAMSGGDGFFAMHPERGDIYVSRPLDFETKSFYNLSIFATDGQLTQRIQLIVRVNDHNEFRPEFSLPVYNFTVSENVPVGGSVAKVNASDADGTNVVHYSIYRTALGTSSHLFRIDSLTGVISAAGQLDHEEALHHELIVMASDLQHPPLFSYARVIVHVSDENDRVPTFVVSSVNATVSETAAVGTSVVQVTAHDRDKGTNSEITYSIVAGNIGYTFDVDGQLGIVRLAKDIDLRFMKKYELVVRATDKGSPPQHSDMRVSIDVTSGEERLPVFGQLSYAAEVAENEPPGTLVTVLSPVSLTTVFYALVGGTGMGLFTIDAHSGIVTTVVPLDYEQQSAYGLVVEASSVTGQSLRLALSIAVLDRNDNRPEFLSDAYFGRVSESALDGSPVLGPDDAPLAVVARDRDSNLNSLLSYRIVEESARRLFAIDSRTGVVRIAAAPPDRETQAVYEFSVQVSDQALDLALAVHAAELAEQGGRRDSPGETSLSALEPATVVVQVDDANDTPPSCEQNPLRVILVLPTFVGVVVATVRARDPDEVGQLAYSLQQPLAADAVAVATACRFSVDPRTGELRVATAASSASVSGVPSQAEVSVVVHDGVHSSVCSILVEQRSAGGGLRFSRSAYEGEAPENSTDAHVVATVQVVGLEFYEPVVFELVTDRELFQIGRTSGVLSTRVGSPLDRETKRTYDVVVRAVGTGSPPKLNQTVVVVTVTDVNDNAPRFMHLPYFATVRVDASTYEIVTRVMAIDSDEGKNALITYDLVSAPGPFLVNTKNGEIFVGSSLALFANKQFDLLVRATDSGDPQLRSVAPVHIKVVTRATPMFAQPQYSVTVRENVPIGAAILTVEATSPLRNKILYSISSGDTYNEFTIQFSTGAVRVNDELDYEQNKLYELTIRAMDVSTGDWADVMVKIFVEDVNDQSPFFELSDYFISVSEAVVVGSEVATLIATDRDSGINAQLHYRLQPSAGAERDSEFFSIEPGSGVVRTRAPLDHERTPLLRFDVIATDGGSPRLSAVAHVHVSLLDVNDNAPQFDELAYRAALSGAARRGQLIAMVTATDADSTDSGRLAYAIVSGNARRAFAVNPLSGAVTVSALHEPPLLEASTYLLNISATDGLHTSFVSLVAVVQRPNHFAPRFQRALYNLAVPENMPAGASIGFVRAIDDDLPGGGDAVDSDVTYSISGDALQAYFRIDHNTGEIFVVQSLDYEKRQMYHLLIEARDSGSRVGFASVYVSVTNVNDELPLFKCEDYRVSVPHTSGAGATIVKVAAIDPDTPSSSNRIRFEMVAGDELSSALFTVEPDNGVVGAVQSLASYAGQTLQFYVQAVDGSPGGGAVAAAAARPRASRAVVSVYVMREDERAPSFVDQDTRAHANESAPLGLVVKHLSASLPADAPEGLQLSYRIVPGMTESTNKLGTFTIGDDGRVTLAQPLDAETLSRYELTVEVSAIDPRQPPTQFSLVQPALVSRTTLDVRIFDDNDNAPVFSSKTYTASVPEDVVPGTKILQLYAEDGDIDNRNSVGYFLAPESSSLSGVFMVDSNGAVFMLSPVDREQAAKYVLKVVASDQDWRGRSLSSTATVVVNVVDVNDEPPRFTNIIHEDGVPYWNDSRVAVHEDALVGTIVVQLHTEDDDLPQNTHIAYSITDGNSLGHFRIRSQGEVYVNKPLDRETVPKYDLEVAASDGVFVTKVRLIIAILDANDNAPLCSQPLYTVVVPESMAVPSQLLRVQARDLDEPGVPHSRITYSLSGDSSDDFAVDPVTGDIQVRRELDRERVASYRLTARAADGGGLYCLMDVAVLLTDVNDNDPVFDQSEYQWTLPEDSPNNTLLMRVSATDKDTGMNRRISYHLAAGGDGRFAVDDRTGIVRVTGSLRREVAQQYVLTVGAADHGMPRRTAFATFTVDIADVNDPPRFELSVYEQHLREDTPVGTSVMSVRASSADTGPNNVVTYRITDAGTDAGLFLLDKVTGVLRTAGTFDYERVREYVLTVEAKDDGEPPLSDYASIKIHITDSNDNSPQFSQQSYSARVREDARLRELVVRVQASDADSGINSALTYAIVGGDELKQFTVDKLTGAITVAAPLDREAIAKYVLIVRAEDGGFPSKSSIVSVDVYVSDVNDNPPRFSQSNYTTVLQEGKNAAYSPLRLDVTDADAPPNNGPFEFSIVSDSSDKFAIRSDGSLIAPGVFSRAEQSEYLIVVRVSDGGSPPLTAEASVLIRIVEATLQPPELAPTIAFHVRTFDGAFPAGGQVGTVVASDPDGDLLVFSISTSASGSSMPPLAADARKLFSIDAQRGVVTAASALDEGRYAASVSVSDGRFTAVGQVEIVVSAISPRLLSEALAVRLIGTDAAEFVGSHQQPFARAVREVAPVPLSAVHILAVQSPSSSIGSLSPSSALAPRSRRSEADASSPASPAAPAVAQPAVEVLLSLERMSDRSPMSRDHVRNLIESQKTTIESIMGGSLRLEPPLSATDGSPCSTRPVGSWTGASTAAASPVCRDDERCTVEYKLDDVPVVIASQKESFTSFGFRAVPRCVCNADSCSNPCLSNPCPANKVCRPLMSTSTNAFACECPENRFGADCKMRTGDPLAFTGMSYAVWELTHSIERRMRLTLRFRTMQKDAVLMDARGKVDFSVLEIEEGKLQYRFECGSGVGKLRVENVAVDDGRWHTVDVERTGNFAKLVLDIPYTVQAYAPGTTDVINLSNKDVYFGGTPKGRDNVERGFRGCMADIRIESDGKVEGDLLLPYGKPNSVGAVKKFQHIQFGCSKIGHCDPNPCLNDGICIESVGGSTCSCKGYTGAQCEYDLDECLKNPCLNGGVCTNLVGSFQCDCATGFSGGVCEVPTSSKEAAPAQSSGVALGTLEIIIIAASSCGLLLIAFVVAVIIRCAISKRRRQANIDGGQRVALSTSSAPKKLGSTDIFRQQSSLSLAEDEGDAHSAEPPTIPPRPTSYTSSVHEGAGRPSNYERVRSYGSAAEGLENLPNMSVFAPAFLQCVESTRPPTVGYASMAPGLPAVPSSATASDTDSIQKPLYEFDYPNIYGNAGGASSSFRPAVPDIQRHRQPPVVSRYRQDESIASFSAAELDDEAYHWDTSDWNPHRSATAAASSSAAAASRRPPPPARSSHARYTHEHLYPPGYQSSDVGEDSEYVGEDSDLEDDLLFPPPPCTSSGAGQPLLLAPHGLQARNRANDDNDDLDDGSVPQFTLPLLQPGHYLPEHRAPSAGGDSERSSGSRAAGRTDPSRVGPVDLKGRTFVPLLHGSSPAVPKRSASLVGARGGGDYRPPLGDDELSSVAGGGGIGGDHELSDSDSDMSGICEIESDYEPNAILTTQRAPSQSDV